MNKKYIPVVMIFGIWGIIALVNGNSCVFKLIWGIPCAGCGMTRAYTSLLHGNIKMAFFYHPLFLMTPLITIAMLSKRKIYPVFWVVCIVLFMAVYIIRMVIFFPDIAPMDYYHNSLLGRIYHYFP